MTLNNLLTIPVLEPRVRVSQTHVTETTMCSSPQSRLAENFAGARCARITVIAENRYLSHAQPRGLITALQALGHSVTVIDPETQSFSVADLSWAAEIDVALARGRSWGVLCLLDWMERLQVPVINRRAAIASVHNKAEMSVALAAAGVPTPRTWLGSPSHIARQLCAADFPVIIKPVFGDNCRGLELACTREQLSAVDWPEAMAVVQTFIPGMAFDLKLYCIGREVWAVRKPSPLAAKRMPELSRHLPQAVPLTDAARDLALRCGEVFGLDLFGVDCIETDAGPLVIEVNEFPNYSAVPGADDKLCNFVLRCIGQERQS